MNKNKQYNIDRKALLKGETVKIAVKIKSISLKGLGIESSKKAKIGTRLEISFEIPAFSEFQQLSIYAIVTQVQNTNDAYFLWLDFEKLTPNEEHIIIDFISYKERLREFSIKKYSSHIT